QMVGSLPLIAGNNIAITESSGAYTIATSNDLTLRNINVTNQATMNTLFVTNLTIVGGGGLDTFWATNASDGTITNITTSGGVGIFGGLYINTGVLHDS